jgi:hypothetical protein
MDVDDVARMPDPEPRRPIPEYDSPGRTEGGSDVGPLGRALLAVLAVVFVACLCAVLVVGTVVSVRLLWGLL